MSKLRDAVWFARDAASILTIGAAFAIGSPRYRERMIDIWETGADIVDNRRGPAPVRVSDEEWERRVREGLPRTGWGGWRDSLVVDDMSPTPAQIVHADEILARGGSLCDRASAGWWCHLELNHDGPCPATSA